jgi:hypothetical protein
LGRDDQAKVLAVNKLDDSFDASPVVSDQLLLLRGEKHQVYAPEQQ